jgi:hypothetical protein
VNKGAKVLIDAAPGKHPPSACGRGFLHIHTFFDLLEMRENFVNEMQ